MVTNNSINLLVLVFVFLSHLNTNAAIYYIDSSNGNDANNGISVDKPWATLHKVNSTDIFPEDSILFKRGSVYSGQLELELQGVEGKIIFVGAYGEGGQKPVINGLGEKRHTILLKNPTWCTVQDLEITNTGHQLEPNRVGLLISAENCGLRRSVFIKNITVKNVNGSLVKKDGAGGGIYWENKGELEITRFVDLQIINCHIVNCGRNGIYSGGYSSRHNWHPNLGVIIRGNLIEGVPGDGIVPIGCDGAVIEHNIMRNCPDILSSDEAAAGIWPWSCDNTVIQYNEVSGHHAKWDGQGFDSDYNCRNTIIQYNYSHDNAGGFLLVCNDGNSLGKSWNTGTENTVVRYNISVNDGLRAYPTKQSGWFSPVIHITGPVSNTQFYGNLIVAKPKSLAQIDKRMIKMDNWGQKWPTQTQFYHNVFVATGGTNALFEFGNGEGTQFRNNFYVGNFINSYETVTGSISENEILSIIDARSPEEKIERLKSWINQQQGENKAFYPGQLWFDTKGDPINAHGGGILYHKGKYYWFGEHKDEKSNAAWVGVMCYSSVDLYNWHNEGVALPVADNDESPIAKGCVLERPKVIYNIKTGKFVMYFHLELKGKGYSSAHVGIAVSDRVTGPYHFVESFRPNAGRWPINMTKAQINAAITPQDFGEWWTDDWREAVMNGLFTRRDFAGGQMSRDMTLFVDDDGIAYHIYSSEENLTLHLAELSNDYLGHTGKYIRIEPGGHNEAPAVFKNDGKYFMITSGCTGWEPNAARLLVADNIWGPWIRHPNPCVGNDADLTFLSQSTYVLPVEGKKNAFIFMADQWRPKNPIDGRYVWLPIQFESGFPVIKWKDKWMLNDFCTD